MEPGGRAFLKASPWTPPHEDTDDEYPLSLVTGRTVYHFHTRTKTGRVPELDGAAPDVWVELTNQDADRFGIRAGDMVRVRSRRGVIEGVARIGGGRVGVVFVPFHYGWWDLDDNEGRGERRAANELTVTEWDPVSKQPVFKEAAVQLERLATHAGSGGAP